MGHVLAAGAATASIATDCAMATAATPCITRLRENRNSIRSLHVEVRAAFDISGPQLVYIQTIPLQSADSPGLKRGAKVASLVEIMASLPVFNGFAKALNGFVFQSRSFVLFGLVASFGTKFSFGRRDVYTMIVGFGGKALFFECRS
jgi:hypothetical protein